MRNIFPPFLFFFVLFFFSCRSDIQEFTGNTETIEVKNGKRFIISLNENHARGENWVVVRESVDNKISYIGSNYHGPSNGKTDFIFSAHAMGEAVIQLNLVVYGEVIKNQKIKVNVK